jgi:class 3 adenylate cyclase
MVMPNGATRCAASTTGCVANPAERGLLRQPSDAVAFAAALHEAAAGEDSLPGLRVGIHHGPAIYRGGDYLGNTVNLASRVTTTATAGQTVLTDAVAERLGDGPPVEELGCRGRARRVPGLRRS